MMFEYLWAVLATHCPPLANLQSYDLFMLTGLYHHGEFPVDLVTGLSSAFVSCVFSWVLAVFD